MANETRIKIKSLGKALTVLECFMNTPEMGVTEISELLGLNKSNVCDILSTFETMGYVDQSARTGKYRLGYRVLELAHSLTASMGFRRTVYPHMKQLAESVGETVYLGVPDGLDVLYMDAAYPGHEYMTRAMLGDRAPMYCTGIGKAILSRMDESVWQRLTDANLIPYTSGTITNHECLLDELRKTRERGFAIDNMEHEHGIRCIGVPIINGLGNVVAGMSISGPSPRLDDERCVRYASLLMDVATRVSIYF